MKRPENVSFSAILVVTWLRLALGGGLPAEAAVAIQTVSECQVSDHIVFNKVGVVNPQYVFDDVPVYDSMTVSFGSIFKGQTLGPDHNSLSQTQPSNPLMLDPNGPPVVTQLDFAHMGGIVLGGKVGSTYYTTPVAMHFSNPVSVVCFDLGHLDDNTPTLIEAYDAQGNSLASLTGLPTGFSTVEILSLDNKNVISGVSIYLPVGTMDWEGFAINDPGFGISDGDNGGMIPEPASAAVWGLLGSLALIGSWASRRFAAGRG